MTMPSGLRHIDLRPTSKLTRALIVALILHIVAAMLYVRSDGTRVGFMLLETASLPMIALVAWLAVRAIGRGA